MRALRLAVVLVVLSTAVVLSSAARLARQVVGLDLATLNNRDVLVIRTTGDVPAPGAVNRDEAAGQVSFLLVNTGADSATPPRTSSTLIKDVLIDTSSPDGTTITVRMRQPELATPDCFRLSQPSAHVILFEVFPQAGLKAGAEPITDVAKQLGLRWDSPATSTPAPASGGVQGEDEEFDPDRLGIPTIDLSGGDASRVLGLAVDEKLLNLSGRCVVATEYWGELKVKPAGQSLASWLSTSPPGEIYLAGDAEKIARFMKRADAKFLPHMPELERVWSEQLSARGARPVPMGTSAGTRARLKDDPYSGLYFTEFVPGGSTLSDVRVSLPAMQGANLYEVLDYLSLISGISLIIDPYLFSEPTGSRRQPLEPDKPEGASGGPGYRAAGLFQPQLNNGGTVMGNFVDVPFDTALQLILSTHELRYVVYQGGSSSAGGTQGGAPRGSAGGKRNSYDKPVVLVTSRERLEQELAGQNTIDLYQFHYADPYQVTDILGNFSLLPGTNTGWYIYGGTGYGQGGGGGYGGGGGGGGYGGGGAGGGGGGRAGGRSNAMPGGATVFRGSSRVPVEQLVAEAVGRGESVVRVVLKPEESGQFVTVFIH